MERRRGTAVSPAQLPTKTKRDLSVVCLMETESLANRDIFCHMKPMEHAIICLGNPGAEYENTRHNLGFWTADILAGKLKCRFKPGRGDFYVAETRRRNREICLVKPTTYMNLSGQAVAQSIGLYKLAVGQIIVVCDDFALEEGRIRLRKKGGDGGHNGLKSIISELGTEDFSRLRLGIGLVPVNVDPVDFVLAKIEESVINDLRNLADRASEAVFDYVTRGFEYTAGKYNVKPSAPTENAGGAE